jgi:hypothetical protein
MANRWIEFVREYAAKNNVSYMCAASSPECKEAYRARFPVVKKPKRPTQKQERETMGKEDINRAGVPYRTVKERKKMFMEDFNRAEKKKPVPPPSPSPSPPPPVSYRRAPSPPLTRVREANQLHEKEMNYAFEDFYHQDRRGDIAPQTKKEQQAQKNYAREVAMDIIKEMKLTRQEVEEVDFLFWFTKAQQKKLLSSLKN